MVYFFVAILNEPVIDLMLVVPPNLSSICTFIVPLAEFVVIIAKAISYVPFNASFEKI